MERAIRLRDVHFSYSDHLESALEGIDLAVGKGECVLVCGASGSGKSTLTRLFNGLSPQYVEGDLEGQVRVFGLDPERNSIEDFVPVVGSVFQNPKTQHFTTTGRNELAFPLENSGVAPEKIEETIEEISRYFQIEPLLDENIFHLSVGQKQQLAFATATVLNPALLVLDEVTSNLDQPSVGRLSQMVGRLKNQGVTILLSEHRLAWLKDLIDRVILLEDGRIRREWTGEEFRTLSNADLHAFNLRAVDLDPYRQKLAGKEDRRTADTSEAPLTTDRLAVGYDKDNPLLSDLDLSFAAGQVTGILGDNGRGKTTLVETLMGLLEPLEGSIYWRGEKVKVKQLLRQSFLVMQDTNYQLFSDSVESEVTLGRDADEKMDEILDKLGLLDLKDRHPMSLSGGQKQRVAIASALLSDKEVLVFDEPTSGLDHHNMKVFGNLLCELKKLDKVILVITHDLELAADWCDALIQL